MLKGKNILLGVTGGIAAYKVPLLVREFKKSGANVRVVMTEAAAEFVAPLTLSTLTGNEVVVGTFAAGSPNVVDAGTWHIKTAEWADAMVVAPATANTLAKLAHGYADNAVTTLVLALRCPLIVSPAMDRDMWQHGATQETIARLREMGYVVLPPEEGELASGLTGAGRLPEIALITRAVSEVVGRARRDLHKKKIVVTAGPTYEAIDPVRFIGNRSSGKMGFALANAAALRGADVVLISGPVRLQTPRSVRRIEVQTAAQMYNAVMKHRKGADAILMAAAVADFTPVHPSPHKIKKGGLRGGRISIELKKTADILEHLAEQRKSGVVVGFALETRQGLRNATLKLREKNMDVVVLNNPMQDGAAFGSDTNIVTIISRRGKPETLPKLPKFEVANKILDRVVRLFKKQ